MYNIHIFTYGEECNAPPGTTKMNQLYLCGRRAVYLPGNDSVYIGEVGRNVQ